MTAEWQASNRLLVVLDGNTYTGRDARTVKRSLYTGAVPYRWLPQALALLAGIEPYEVHQVLSAQRRRPVPAVRRCTSTDDLGSKPRTAGHSSWLFGGSSPLSS